jgi:hypothetical protein
MDLKLARSYFVAALLFTGMSLVLTVWQALDDWRGVHVDFNGEPVHLPISTPLAVVAMLAAAIGSTVALLIARRQFHRATHHRDHWVWIPPIAVAVGGMLVSSLTFQIWPGLLLGASALAALLTWRPAKVVAATPRAVAAA